MAKVKKSFVCQSCGNSSPQWVGRCPSCGEWNTYVEEIQVKESAKSAGKSLVTKETGRKPQRVQEVDFEILPSSLRVNLNDPSDYELIIERMEGNPAVKEIRASGEAIDRLLSLTNTLVISASVFAILIAFAAFILIINTLRLTAYAKRKEIKIMKTLGASSTYIRLPFIFEAIFESLVGTSIAIGLGWAVIQYSKGSVIAESIFDITISDAYLINLTLGLILASVLFGLVASFIGIRKALND